MKKILALIPILASFAFASGGPADTLAELIMGVLCLGMCMYALVGIGMIIYACFLLIVISISTLYDYIIKAWNFSSGILNIFIKTLMLIGFSLIFGFLSYVFYSISYSIIPVCIFWIVAYYISTFFTGWAMSGNTALINKLEALKITVLEREGTYAKISRFIATLPVHHKYVLRKKEKEKIQKLQELYKNNVIKIFEDFKTYGNSTKLLLYANHSLLATILDDTYNKNRKYGVTTKVIHINSEGTLTIDKDYNQFHEVLDKCATRQLTGKAARNAICNTIQLFTADSQKFLLKIIARKLAPRVSLDDWWDEMDLHFYCKKK